MRSFDEAYVQGYISRCTCEVHVCVCVRVSVCIYTYIYIYICTLCVFMHACEYVNIYISVCVLVYMLVNRYVHASPDGASYQQLPALDGFRNPFYFKTGATLFWVAVQELTLNYNNKYIYIYISYIIWFLNCSILT